MSNADSEELVTAASDGVSVEKSFEPDDFPVPAIAFVLRSDRSETVTVRLVDTVPSRVPPEDIGFHPKYGAEFWDVEGDTIVFEREFEPNEEYTTVYGLRGGDANDAEDFMSEPTIESVDPPLDDGDSGDVVRDVIGESGGESSEDDIASAIDGIEADSDIDPEENGSRPASAAHDESDAGASASEDLDVDAGADADDQVETSVDLSDAGAIAADESLVAALAAEIREAEHDDEDLRTLRDAMDVDLASASVEARIEHLQSEVSDLAAYTEALEEFLDEEGTAEQVIDDLRSEFEATTERLEEVEATAESAAETAESVDDELDEVWSAVDDAASDAEDVSEDVESLRADLESLEADLDEATSERLSELESDVEELSEELSDVAEMRDRLANALGGLSGNGDD